MPDIDLIPEVLHQSSDPYHHHYDNLPLRNILTRQQLINSAVDINSAILRDAVGTQGTLSNRLNQSINADGSLKSVAIDEAMHNIAYHTDGSIVISGIETEFVRMLKSERDKLELVSDEATALSIQMSLGVSETPVTFEDEVVIFQNSDTVTWSVTEPNIVTANTTFPSEAARRFYYDVTPVRQGSDYINWKTTSSNQAYIDATLRVYINGIRITNDGIYVPSADGPDGTWTLTSIASTTPDEGLFSLNRAITSSDIIRIDFDAAYE